MTPDDDRNEPGPPRSRRGLWLALAIGAVAILVFTLARAFPEAVSTRDDWASVAYTSILVLVISAGVFRAQRGALSQHLRHAAIWLGIAAVIALGFAYRDVFADTRQRLAMSFSGGAPVQLAERELAVPQDASGHFLVIGAVNGQRVRFVVDTGATDTVLSPADARRVGINPNGLVFDQQAETANGVGYGALFQADSLQVGPIRFAPFELNVNQSPLSASLLGMSFLRRLESYEVRGDTLYLRWRDAG